MARLRVRNALRPVASWTRLHAPKARAWLRPLYVPHVGVPYVSLTCPGVPYVSLTSPSSYVPRMSPPCPSVCPSLCPLRVPSCLRVPNPSGHTKRPPLVQLWYMSRWYSMAGVRKAARPVLMGEAGVSGVVADPAPCPSVSPRHAPRSRPARPWNRRRHRHRHRHLLKSRGRLEAYGVPYSVRASLRLPDFPSCRVELAPPALSAPITPASLPLSLLLPLRLPLPRV